MNTKERFDIPIQIKALLDALVSKKDSDHIRYNFRMRLAAIRDVIDSTIKAFDSEMEEKRNRR